MQDFLPINKKDMQKRGWDCVDFVYVTGDAYIDHPSFGSAIICWRAEDIGSESLHSLTGAKKKVFRYLVSHVSDFLLRPEIWTRW